MKKTLNDLAEFVGCTTSALRPYLDRAEFNSCRTGRSYLFDMQPQEMYRLKELVVNRSRKNDNVEKNNEFGKKGL